MPREADSNLFTRRDTHEQAHKPLYTPPKPAPKNFTKDLDAGMREVIDQGDHMASILRRVVSEQHTPKLTINNALDEWDSVVLGFEERDDEPKSL